MQRPELSIILPVYKNRNTVRELHRQLSETLVEKSVEFVFVDDACPENSLEILQEMAQADPRITVLALAQNIGQQRAVLAGMQHAQGEVLVIMDADLQDPPHAVPMLLEKLKEGHDVVFGGRAGHYQVGHRLLTSRLYKWTLHFLLKVPANAGLFLAMKRAHLDALLALPIDTPHLVAMIGALRLKNISVSVKRDERPSGMSAYTSWMRLKLGFGAAFWALRWRLGFMPDTHNPISDHPLKEFIPSQYHGLGA